MIITPDQTPVTDDDRKAHEFSDSVHNNPDCYGDSIRAAARAIRAHVPAPPATLADQMRTIADIIGSDFDAEAQRLDTLADRVEAVEKHNEEVVGIVDDLTEQRDEARAELDRASVAFDEVEALNLNLESDLHEARAEVQWRSELLGRKDIRIRDQRRELARLNAEVERLTRDRTCKESLPVALSDPADVPEGEPWLIHRRGQLIPAISTSKGDVNRWMTFSLGVACSLKNESINLVSRLVPDTRRTIDRPEDLDKLPEGSVVLDEDGFPIYKMTRPFWRSYQEAPELNAAAVISTYGSVTVIHEPMVDSGSDS
ncbi:hypothetical protein [Corynebacterium sp.]|uniref:hypothetical protein n=1 Tax=Corynebacterium sp. TaxID=1720 RepID=UPI0028AEE1F7|nr:hypothetical protein [Corynebacterium sp.]